MCIISLPGSVPGQAGLTQSAEVGSDDPWMFLFGGWVLGWVFFWLLLLCIASLKGKFFPFYLLSLLYSFIQQDVC